ncbi:MAG: hypothetical protein KDK37_05275 [Leptospiraceae bacterium]|nr:hypothetical protein [Leptospiraceae bacterium]MCB1303662.1 hypothetical protein [Leptospiraceae bacterium]
MSEENMNEAGATGGNAEKLKQGYEQIKGQAQKARARAQETYDQARARAAVYGEGAQEFVDAAGEYVKENPERSTLIAGVTGLGFGLLLGLLIGRKN